MFLNKLYNSYLTIHSLSGNSATNLQKGVSNHYGRQTSSYDLQQASWQLAQYFCCASRPAKVYDTKAQAQAAGRQTAINNKAEHIVHNHNGQIASRNSYGGDPYPPKV